MTLRPIHDTPNPDAPTTRPAPRLAVPREANPVGDAQVIRLPLVRHSDNPWGDLRQSFRDIAHVCPERDAVETLLRRQAHNVTMLTVDTQGKLSNIEGAYPLSNNVDTDALRGRHYSAVVAAHTPLGGAIVAGLQGKTSSVTTTCSGLAQDIVSHDAAAVLGMVVPLQFYRRGPVLGAVVFLCAVYAAVP